MTDYETVIGLEIHAQLLTKSKLFCGCSTDFGVAENRNVCPVCLGLPGSLPVLNEEAVAMAVRAALALRCRIEARSMFARKNYFYPDLPKGYQISQYEEPYSVRGQLEIDVGDQVKQVGITRVHMEEDAGKTVHGLGGDSVVNLNRAGVPLIEIVSEPDLRSSAEAAAYMRTLRDVLVFLGVNDGNLEQGSFRCDANVSLRPVGQIEFGTRCELKNINSFRFVQRAIDAEVARQKQLLDSGEPIEQQTRSYDPDTNRTKTLRSKEDAHDYRYFPDPDLPPLRLTDEFVACQAQLVNELPRQIRRRFVGELGLPPSAAETLTGHPAITRFFERTLEHFDNPQKVANWVQTEVLRDVRLEGLRAEFPVSPEQVAELLSLVEKRQISGKQAKDVYAKLKGSEQTPTQIVRDSGLRLVSDESTLEPLCRRLLAEHPKQVAAIRGGKQAVIGFFVGQVLKETRGQADPKLVTELLKKLIAET